MSRAFKRSLRALRRRVREQGKTSRNTRKDPREYIITTLEEFKDA